MSILENLSLKNQLVIVAHNKGYRVKESGAVISPSGKFLNLRNYRSKKSKIPYYGFSLTSVSKSLVLVHKLQAYQKFAEKIFEAGIVVRHKNGNSLDNSYGNILIGTLKDNSLDIPKEKRVIIATHASQFVRVWSDDQLKEIFDDRYKNGFTYKNLNEKYNIAKSTLAFLFKKSLFASSYLKNKLDYHKSIG